MRRVLLVAAAAACALAAVVPANAARRLPYSRTLLVVGDSLTVGTQPYLPHFLPGWRIRQDVSVSKQVTEGPAALRRFGRRLPRVIFVNLGTNGDPRGVGVFLRALRQVMHIAGRHRCVVWSTIVRPSVGGASYRTLNRVLRQQGTKRHNLIVFKWSALAARHPSWFGPDHVHVTASAYRVRARAMASDIRRCRTIAIR
jgi:lysophospholipase L1-like esterase